MKILIIDDHTLFRSGMVHLLENLDPKPEIVESHSLQSITLILYYSICAWVIRPALMA